MHKALHPKDYIDYISQEKEEEEDSPTLKIASIYRYGDSKNTLKKEQRKTNYRDEKHKDQKNNNNKETELGRKNLFG